MFGVGVLECGEFGCVVAMGLVCAVSGWAVFGKSGVGCGSGSLVVVGGWGCVVVLGVVAAV